MLRKTKHESPRMRIDPRRLFHEGSAEPYSRARMRGFVGVAGGSWCGTMNSFTSPSLPLGAGTLLRHAPSPPPQKIKTKCKGHRGLRYSSRRRRCLFASRPAPYPIHVRVCVYGLLSLPVSCTCFPFSGPKFTVYSLPRLPLHHDIMCKDCVFFFFF
jgi:hypothetical protein